MTKIPGPPVGYTDLLDHAIQEKQKNSTKKYFPLRPSAAGFCARRLAYDLMEYFGFEDYKKEPIDPATYRLFELGHSVEYSVLRMFDMVEFVQSKYKQQSLTCFKLNKEDPLVQERIIEGSCDVCFMSEEFKCVMDVKSVKDGFSRAFKTRWNQTIDKYNNMKSLVAISDSAWYAEDVEAFLAEIGEDFLYENIIQLNLYACTDFMKERGVDHAVIYKYNKNDSRHYELRFKPSQALADMVQDKFNNIHKSVVNKEPEKVKKDYMLGSMHCSFCPYAKQCWPEADTKKAFFANFPKKKWPTDIAKLKDPALEADFAAYEIETNAGERAKAVELNIVERLREQKITKIRLDNGHIYEVKFLKSPKPHYELRRGKL